MENVNMDNAANRPAREEFASVLKNQEDMKTEMEELRGELKKVRRSLRTSKMINILTLLIILALIGGGAFVGYQAYRIYTEYAEPVVNEASELDFDELAETLDSIDLNEVTATIEKLQDLDISQMLDKLDEISREIEDLQTDIADRSSY